MERFEASAVTHMLVVSDVSASRDWYVRVLDAEVFGEYGGPSVVLLLLGAWLLLLTGGAPDEGKPAVNLAPPSDPDLVSAQLIFRVEDWGRALHHDAPGGHRRDEFAQGLFEAPRVPVAPGRRLRRAAALRVPRCRTGAALPCRP